MGALSSGPLGHWLCPQGCGHQYIEAGWKLLALEEAWLVQERALHRMEGAGDPPVAGARGRAAGARGLGPAPA